MCGECIDPRLTSFKRRLHQFICLITPNAYNPSRGRAPLLISCYNVDSFLTSVPVK